MRGWTVAPLALALAACAERTPTAPTAATVPAPAGPAAPAAVSGTLPGDLVPAFQAKVRRASSEAALDSRAAKGPSVYVVMSTRCPYCSEAADPLKRAETAFQGRGVEFVYLYSTRAEPEAEKVAWHAEQGFAAGQVLDGDAAIARMLRADKTPTAWLVDARGVILYRGSVVEEGTGGPARHPLADAIDEHLAGKKVSVPSTEPAG